MLWRGCRRRAWRRSRQLPAVAANYCCLHTPCAGLPAASCCCPGSCSSYARQTTAVCILPVVRCRVQQLHSHQLLGLASRWLLLAAQFGQPAEPELDAKRIAGTALLPAPDACMRLGRPCVRTRPRRLVCRQMQSRRQFRALPCSGCGPAEHRSAARLGLLRRWDQEKKPPLRSACRRSRRDATCAKGSILCDRKAATLIQC